MNIALDYDGTYTSDPLLWDVFIVAALSRGHKVFVVTMRYPSEGSSFLPSLLKHGLPVVFTSRKAKRPACAELGLELHIWLDDHPEAVDRNASDIWPNPAPEGKPVVPVYD